MLGGSTGACYRCWQGTQGPGTGAGGYTGACYRCWQGTQGPATGAGRVQRGLLQVLAGYKGACYRCWEGTKGPATGDGRVHWGLLQVLGGYTGACYRCWEGTKRPATGAGRVHWGLLQVLAGYTGACYRCWQGTLGPATGAGRVQKGLLRCLVSADSQAIAESQLSLSQTTFTIPAGQSGASQPLTVTCRPPPTPVRFLYKLTISRSPLNSVYSGPTLAKVAHGANNGEAQLMTDGDGWSVSGTRVSSVLTLTIPHPTCSDEGKYRCDAVYNGPSGPTQATSLAIVTVKGE